MSWLDCSTLLPVLLSHCCAAVVEIGLMQTRQPAIVTASAAGVVITRSIITITCEIPSCLMSFIRCRDKSILSAIEISLL